jgi:signal transduction histidine kinase
VLALVVATDRPEIAGPLLGVIGVLVAFNYLALRNWPAVVQDLRIAEKPHYPLLDAVLALLVLAYVGIGTPMVLYLIASTLIAGLVYPALITLCLGLLLVAGYALQLVQGVGLVPGRPDFHTTVTLPALIVLAGVAGGATRRVLSAQERSGRELARLRGDVAVREERLRMARDLHDTVTKNLHGVRLISHCLVEDLDRGDVPAAREAAGAIHRTAAELTTHARRAIHDLRDPLSAEPFDDAVRAVAGRAVEGHDLRVQVVDRRTSGDPAPTLPVRQEVLALVSEAVHNTVKHADADQVDVTLAQVGGELEVTISDDGRGFPAGPETSVAPRRAGHFGLLGMRERAERVDGRVSLRSAPGAGTTVQVRVPVAGGSALSGSAPSGPVTGELEILVGRI